MAIWDGRVSNTAQLQVVDGFDTKQEFLTRNFPYRVIIDGRATNKAKKWAKAYMKGHCITEQYMNGRVEYNFSKKEDADFFESFIVGEENES